jgi:probable F420-dependent oxidoreductase
MDFVTSVPGITRYPLAAEPWHADLGSDEFRQIAVAAEALGFDEIALSEHLVMPIEHVELMGPQWPHALGAMSFFAGCTTRIRVSSSVIILPIHNPIELAKEVATLDVLSGGRVLIAVGLGSDLPREFDIFHVRMDERASRTDEYLQAMIELWTSDNPAFHGQYVDFDAIAFEPKPRQRPYPPIWIGGNSRPAMRRAVRFGDGWQPWQTTVDDLPRCLEYMRRQPEFEARTRPLGIYLMLDNPQVDDDHRPLDGSTGRPDMRVASEYVDLIGRMEAAGVTRVFVPLPPASSLTAYLEQLQYFSEDIMSHFRDKAVEVLRL